MKCEYCKRDATRYYNGKHLCELHYLKENPERNRKLVDWGKLRQMRMPTNEIIFVITQRKILNMEANLKCPR